MRALLIGRLAAAILASPAGTASAQPCGTLVASPRFVPAAGIDGVTAGGTGDALLREHTALDGLREGLAVTADATARAGVDTHTGDVQRALEELQDTSALVVGTPRP